MSRKKEFICLVAVILCFSGYHIVRFGASMYGETVTTNEDKFVASIYGLNIGGTRYDVTFHYDKSFDGLFGTGDPPIGFAPQFYYDGSDAAREAIIDTLHTQMIRNDGDAQNYLYIPHRWEGVTKPNELVSASAIVADAYSNRWLEVILHNLPRQQQGMRSEGWASFEPASPDPVSKPNGTLPPSVFQTITKYWSAWTKFIMKKAGNTE